MFGRADNSLSGTDGDESYVEVNNDIEKKSHQHNEFVEEFGGTSKVSENSKEGKELQCTDLKLQESNSLDPHEFYGLRFSKMDPNITYPCEMYWKVEVLRPLPSLLYKGSKIERPGGDQCTIRPGDEVFVSSTARKYAADCSFIVFGVFLDDIKHPENCMVLLVNEETFKSNKHSFEMFKAAPLKHIGHIPNGKCAPDTEPLLVEVTPVVSKLLLHLQAQHVEKPLQTLDFVKTPMKAQNVKVLKPLLPKVELETTSSMITRNKTTAPLPPVPKFSEDDSKKQKKNPAENVCLEAINKKLSNIEAICQDIQKKDAGKISRLQKEAAKINIQWKDCAAENEHLKLQVLQLNSLQIENDLLKQENVDCKGKILQLEEDNKALKKVNDELSIENRIFTEKLQVGFSSKHNKNRKKKTKKPSKTKKRKHSSSDSSTSSSDSG